MARLQRMLQWKARYGVSCSVPYVARSDGRPLQAEYDKEGRGPRPPWRDVLPCLFAALFWVIFCIRVLQSKAFTKKNKKYNPLAA